MPAENTVIDDKTAYSGRTFYVVLAAAVGGAVWATTVNGRLSSIEKTISERTKDRIYRSDFVQWVDRLRDKNPAISIPDLYER